MKGPKRLRKLFLLTPIKMLTYELTAVKITLNQMSTMKKKKDEISTLVAYR